MGLLFVILILVLISVAWAFLSLRNLNSKSETAEVKKKLSKGRVIFHDSSLLGK